MRTVFCVLILSSLFVSHTDGTTRPQDFPDGEGRQVFMGKCGQCHNLEYAAANRHTRGQWGGIIRQMIETGADVTDEDRAAIVEYLTKNFGKISINTAPVEEIETILDLTSKDAKAIVAYRSEHGPFKSLDELKEVPDIDLKILDEKKSWILF